MLSWRPAATLYVRPHIYVEGVGRRRRTTMKWLSVVAVVGLLALADGLKTSSVTRRDGGATIQADDAEAGYANGLDFTFWRGAAPQ